jgi:hypothetical protein
VKVQATIETVDADSDHTTVKQAVGDIGEYFRAMFQLFLNKFADKEINHLKSADGEELQPLRVLILKCQTVGLFLWLKNIVLIKNLL